MSVDIIFSTIEDSEALTEPLDLGEGTVSDNLSEVQVFIRHTGEQPITNAKLYLGSYSDSYDSVSDPQTDYDNIVNQSIGLLKINIDYANNFPSGSWVTVGSSNLNSLTNAIALGTIPAGEETGVSIKLKFSFNGSISDSNKIGRRLIDLRLTYTYTN